MRKIRDLEKNIEREIKEGDEVTGTETLTQELYCTEGRYKSIPVLANFNVYEENISLLNQQVVNLRIVHLPKIVEYEGFTYKIDEKTRTSLREISELSSKGEMYEYSSSYGNTNISGEDAINIRKLMLNTTQPIFRKFKVLSDMILDLKDMQDIESFKVLENWILS